MLEEGLEQRYARYTQNWRILRTGIQELGFDILTEPEVESHILFTVLYPDWPEFDFTVLHDRLYAQGFTIYPGKIGHKQTFRLANMGAIDARDIENFLTALQGVLQDMRNNNSIDKINPS